MLNERSLLSQFLHFVAATVASLMVFSLYSIVDGLMVAKGVGEYAMAAVNLAVPFTNVLFSIGVIFAVGTSHLSGAGAGGEGQQPVLPEHRAADVYRAGHLYSRVRVFGALRRAAGCQGRDVSIYHRLSPGSCPLRAVLYRLL